MQNLQSFYPSSPKKDFERATFTETHTHTDHLHSNFDTLHDEITTEGAQRYQALTHAEIHDFERKTLNKARSMPHAQFTQFRDPYIRDSVVVETPIDFRKTAHNLNNLAQNVQFNSFSPVPNRMKPTELNQTMNTNMESRQFVAQSSTPNQTPKLIQKSTSGFLPQQVFDFNTQELRPSASTIIQNQVINQGGIPPSNQRMSFQTNEYVPQANIIQTNFQRASLMMAGSRPSVVSVANRPSFYAQQSNVIPADSRNVQKSNATVAETRAQYQSIIVDQKGNVVNPLAGQTSRQQKFSFVTDTLPDVNTIQEPYQEVEIQRPDYRKIYNNKGEYYRTAGPQEDYFKEEKTCCSKLLPILGILALLLLIGGTLVGIGVMTGLIGGKNYLSKFQGGIIQKNDVAPSTIEKVEQDNKFVANDVENGKVEPSAPTDTTDTKIVVTPPVVVANTTIEEPIVNDKVPIVKNETIAKPTVVEPPKIENVTQTIEKPIIQPVIQPKLPTIDNQVTYIESTETVETEAKKPIKVQPNVSQGETVQTTVVEIIETKPVQPSVVETIETTVVEPAKVVESVKPASVETIKPVIVEPVKPAPSVVSIEPAFVQPTKIQPIIVKPVSQPTKPVELTTIEPTIITVTQPTVTSPPVTQPTVTQPTDISSNATKPTVISPTIIQTNVTSPTVIQSTTSPISTEQAQKVINTIIEQNNDIIPLNYKTSLKQDILTELQTVPLNFRDAHQVEILAYQHIEKVTGKTTQHKFTDF